MKKIIFGMFASMLLTSAVYAGGAKKHVTKHVAKKQTCNPANCPSTSNCHPANCVNMPGCICK